MLGSMMMLRRVSVEVAPSQMRDGPSLNVPQRGLGCRQLLGENETRIVKSRTFSRQDYSAAIDSP